MYLHHKIRKITSGAPCNVNPRNGNQSIGMVSSLRPEYVTKANPAYLLKFNNM